MRKKTPRADNPKKRRSLSPRLFKIPIPIFRPRSRFSGAGNEWKLPSEQNREASRSTSTKIRIKRNAAATAILNRHAVGHSIQKASVPRAPFRTQERGYLYNITMNRFFTQVFFPLFEKFARLFPFDDKIRHPLRLPRTRISQVVFFRASFEILFRSAKITKFPYKTEAFSKNFMQKRPFRVFDFLISKIRFLYKKNGDPREKPTPFKRKRFAIYFPTCYNK